MKILGLRSGSTLDIWKSGAVTEVSRDALERISYSLTLRMLTRGFENRTRRRFSGV